MNWTGSADTIVVGGGLVGTAIAWPAWIGLLTGIVVICGILWLFGKDPDVEPDAV